MKIDTLRKRLELDPRDPEFVQNPYPAYHAIRLSMPVFHWEDYGHRCFAGFDDVNALLRDRRFGRQITHVMDRDEAGLPPIPEHLQAFYAFEQHSLLELEPPVHTRLRGLVNRAFLSRQVERLKPRLVKLCHDLIDAVEGQGSFDILTAYATPIPVIMIAELLGVPADMAPRLLEWSHDMVAMYQVRRDREVEDKAEAATVAFTAYMRALLKERRKAPSGDLLSELLAAEAEGTKLSEAELLTTAILLLNAGHEATVHAIANGIKALLETGCDPREPGVVEETLRYDAPLHLFTRYVLEDLDYAGERFRRGEVVGLMLGAANRDPARFPEPDRFLPARAPNPHVSFGAGLHFCIGAPLARLELAAAYEVLFQRLPRLALASPLRYRDTYHFHGLEALIVHG